MNDIIKDKARNLAASFNQIGRDSFLETLVNNYGNQFINAGGISYEITRIQDILFEIPAGGYCVHTEFLVSSLSQNEQPNGELILSMDSLAANIGSPRENLSLSFCHNVRYRPVTEQDIERLWLMDFLIHDGNWNPHPCECIFKPSQMIGVSEVLFPDLDRTDSPVYTGYFPDDLEEEEDE